MVLAFEIQNTIAGRMNNDPVGFPPNKTLLVGYQCFVLKLLCATNVLYSQCLQYLIHQCSEEWGSRESALSKEQGAWLPKDS